MTDIYDAASEIEQLDREVALANILQHAPHGISASECADCGLAIPAARQAAMQGCTRCIVCQQISEKRKPS